MSNKKVKRPENNDSDIEEEGSGSERDSDVDSEGNYIGEKVIDITSTNTCFIICTK